MLVRLQKFLADAGVASRRAAETIIEEGRVSVNGQIVATLGSKIDPERDAIKFDGRLLKPKRKLYIALNKPVRCICSRNDPESRHSIMDLLPKEWSNLHSVGRLDFKSEGLIFLTNDGDFSLRLTHPRYGVAKKYWIWIKGSLDGEAIRTLKKGIYQDGEILKAEEVRIKKETAAGTVVELVLKGGKNREIRRMFEAMSIEVERLLRVQIGSIRLGELPSGKWRTLTAVEIKSLMQSTKEEPAPSRRPATGEGRRGATFSAK